MKSRVSKSRGFDSMTAIRGSRMRLSPVQATKQDWLAWLKKAKKVKNNTEISSLVFIPCKSNQAFNWIFKSRSFFLRLYSLSVKCVSLHLARVSTLWLQDPQAAPESQPHVAPGQGAKILINWIWIWNEFVLPPKKQAYKETKKKKLRKMLTICVFP